MEEFNSNAPVGVVGEVVQEAPKENQVERIKRELEHTSDSYLRTYVLDKAKEFERLRAQYEQQLDIVKNELWRLGTAADSQNLRAAKIGMVQRDAEWLEALKTIPTLQITIDDGLVNIPATFVALRTFIVGLAKGTV